MATPSSPDSPAPPASPPPDQAPDQIPDQPPDQPPDRAPRREKIATWVAICGGVIGVLTAAAGLFYTGLQVQQGSSVLNMQRNDALKAQAETVGIWQSSDFRPGYMPVTVSNRSSDPLYRFQIYIAMRAGGRRDISIQAYNNFLPCEQVTFNLAPLAAEIKDVSLVALLDGKDMQYDYGITFTDSSGQAWHRHAGGGIYGNPWLEPFNTGTRLPRVPKQFSGYTAPVEPAAALPQTGGTFLVGRPVQAADCTS
jgi:hypothetical protein